MKRAFVIGHPIAHSRSPLIHRYWLDRYGIDGSYEAIDVAPEVLPAFLERLRQGEFVGGNVTVPHKEAVFSLVDHHDLETKHLGAYNTLGRMETAGSGEVRGTNTDLHGFLANLDAAAPGWDDGLDQAILLGAGGAARAVAAALTLRVKGKVHVLNRSHDRAQALAADLGGALQGAGMDAFPRLAPKAGLLVNTTSVGMHGTRFPDLPLELLPKSALVTDIVYVPLETPLLADARSIGLRTVDGLGMLLHQAVPGFECWFGVRPDVTAELRAKIEATL
ncbi:MAG TPA: shikimate dehydrogenase [Devosiaceae bacterium]|nr:shikimate dehydrogenase [Devosiaceae bacterium]